MSVNGVARRCPPQGAIISPLLLLNKPVGYSQASLDPGMRPSQQSHLEQSFRPFQLVWTVSNLTLPCVHSAPPSTGFLLSPGHCWGTLDSPSKPGFHGTSWKALTLSPQRPLQGLLLPCSAKAEFLRWTPYGALL